MDTSTPAFIDRHVSSAAAPPPPPASGGVRALLSRQRSIWRGCCGGSEAEAAVRVHLRTREAFLTSSRVITTNKAVSLSLSVSPSLSPSSSGACVLSRRRQRCRAAAEERKSSDPEARFKCILGRQGACCCPACLREAAWVGAARAACRPAPVCVCGGGGRVTNPSVICPPHMRVTRTVLLFPVGFLAAFSSCLSLFFVSRSHEGEREAAERTPTSARNCCGCDAAAAVDIHSCTRFHDQDLSRSRAFPLPLSLSLSVCLFLSLSLSF